MKNPYKELSPYIESDAHRFKGRTSETEEMYESFDRNEYLVCHADSGEGKSSIIEAGLIPKMKANCYFPVRIIFKSDEHFNKNNIDFDNVVCGIIENEIEKLSSNKSISVNVVYPRRLTNRDDFELTNWEKELVDSYAWLKLRYERVTIDNLLYTPVLIFDQFEEVFTNPLSQEWTDKFFKWLQELSTDLCPQRIINELEKHIGNDVFPEINTQKYFKAIFSLRSEYVGKLDYWGLQRHYIPLLKNNRYLLRPLTIKGAKEVITQQEGYDGLNAVADEIIDVLRRQQKGKNYVMNKKSELPCIPALFLSIICSRAFSMSQEERAIFMQRFVAKKDEDKETAINSLVESFYEKAVADCAIPSKDMGVIEDILVNNEGSRQRVSSHADVLKAIDFSTKYMAKLKEARLIRVILEYNREDDSIEFVHDALCPIIAKRKDLRLAAEAQKREEEKLRELTKKNRKRMTVMLAVFFVAIGVIAFVLHQMRQIEEANWHMQEIQSRFLAENASMLVDEGDAYTARRLALEALPMNLEHPERPYTLEAEAALRKASYLNSGVFVGHSGIVTAVSYSPDESLIASASVDSTIKIWNPEIGKALFTLRGHTGRVNDVKFSPDGKWIASSSSDKTVRLWDINNKKCNFILKGHQEDVGNIVFSRDNHYILSESSKNGIVCLWDVLTGKQIRKYKLKHGLKLLFSADGKRIVACDDNVSYIWDAISGELIQTIKCPIESTITLPSGFIIGDYRKITLYAISSDGEFLAYTNSLGTVYVMDLYSKEIILDFQAKEALRMLAFGPNDKEIVYSLSQGEILTTRIDNQAYQTLLNGYGSDSPVIAYNSKGNNIIIAKHDNSFEVRDLYSIGTPIGRDSFNNGGFSQDKKYGAFIKDGKTLSIYDMSKKKIYKSFVGINNYTDNLYVSNGGQFLAEFVWEYGNAEKTYWRRCEKINVYDVKKGLLKCIVDSVNVFAFSEDNNLLVCGYGNVIKVMNTADFNIQKILVLNKTKDRNDHISSIVVSPDSKMLAAFDGTYITLLNIDSGKQFTICEKSSSPPEFFNYGKNIAFIGKDRKTIFLVDSRSIKTFDTLSSFAISIKSISFSSDGKLMVSLDSKVGVMIWDVHNRMPLFPLYLEEVPQNVFFSADNNEILVVNSSGTVETFPYPSLQELINRTRERFKERPLTPEERREYYLE